MRELIKRKSLIVCLASSVLIAVVLIVSLFSYIIYLEIKNEEHKRAYTEALRKIMTKVYAIHLTALPVNARIERVGALKNKPVIEGAIRNSGYRDVSGLTVKATLYDKDGAAIYSVSFEPQEPSLGMMPTSQLPIPYLTPLRKTIIPAGSTLAFKRIMNDCPAEIISVLSEKTGFAKDTGRWTGNVEIEFLSIDI